MAVSEKHLRCVGLLLLRVGVGVSLCVAHGWDKLMGGPEKWAKVGAAGMSTFGIDQGLQAFGLIASLSESIFALMVAVGLLTRSAATLAALTMFTAMAMHIDNGDSFGKISHPLELGVVFAAIALMGPGRLSLDYLIKRR